MGYSLVLTVFMVISDFRFLNATTDSNLSFGMNFGVVLVCYYFTLRHALFHNTLAMSVVFVGAWVMFVATFTIVVTDGRLSVVIEAVLLAILLTT
jgi:hypothetical protein